MRKVLAIEFIVLRIATEQGSRFLEMLYPEPEFVNV
jgi:hypothetical protein